MLKGHDLARLSRKFSGDLTTPRPVFERLMRPSCLLNGRDVLPGLVVSGTVPMMQRIEDAKPCVPRRNQDLQHVRHAIIRLCNSLKELPNLATLGYEIVIRIDHEKPRNRFAVGHFRHAIPLTSLSAAL